MSIIREIVERRNEPEIILEGEKKDQLVEALKGMFSDDTWLDKVKNATRIRLVRYRPENPITGWHAMGRDWYLE